MYKNNSIPASLDSASLELSKIVENTDIFNSEILYKITQYPDYKLHNKVISVAGMAPESVSNDTYGDYKLSWLIVIFNGYPDGGTYPINTQIRYPELSDLITYLSKS